MKCPKCGYATFPYVDNCGKCGRTLADAGEPFGVYAVRPNPPDLMLADELMRMEPAGVEPGGTTASTRIDLNHLDEIALEVATAGDSPLDASEDRERPPLAEDDGRSLGPDGRPGAADVDVDQPFELDLTDGDVTFTLRPVEEEVSLGDEVQEEDSGQFLEGTDGLELEVLEIEELDVEGDEDAGPTDEDEGDDDR